MLAIVCAVNARLPWLLRALADSGLIGAAVQLLNVSAVLWFALWAVWVISSRTDEPAPPSRADWIILAVMATGSLLPFQATAAFAGLAGAVWLLWSAPPASAGRRLALVMLAISGNIIIAKVIIQTAGTPMLALDARFVAWLSATSASGNVVNFSDADSFVITGGCSSVHNMSIGVLCWMVLVQLFALRIDWRLVGFLGVTLVTLFLINAARLATIARHHGDFVMLHEGWGADLFGLASLVAVVMISGWGVLDAARRQA